MIIPVSSILYSVYSVYYTVYTVNCQTRMPTFSHHHVILCYSLLQLRFFCIVSYDALAEQLYYSI